ncbi:unnamed protein product [Pleuronectes platessa]|uniref:Uncharacterized protein n=1 Tax=Pleuronectes platessa TaxID=8262 RepID=A0A9N7Y250_PLEPL|nr:unnamed protein product [Pleuronectes platessa]
MSLKELEEEEGGGWRRKVEEGGGRRRKEKEKEGGGGRRRKEEGEGRWRREEEGGGRRRKEKEGGGGRRKEEGGGGRWRKEEGGGGRWRREEEEGGGRRRKEEEGGGRRRKEEEGGGRWREEEEGGGRVLICTFIILILIFLIFIICGSSTSHRMLAPNQPAVSLSSWFVVRQAGERVFQSPGVDSGPIYHDSVNRNEDGRLSVHTSRPLLIGSCRGRRGRGGGGRGGEEEEEGVRDVLVSSRGGRYPATLESIRLYMPQEMSSGGMDGWIVVHGEKTRSASRGDGHETDESRAPEHSE